MIRTESPDNFGYTADKSEIISPLNSQAVEYVSNAAMDKTEYVRIWKPRLNEENTETEYIKIWSNKSARG